MKRVLLAVVLAVAVVAGLIVWVLASPDEDKPRLPRSAPPSAEPTTSSPKPRAVGSGCPTRAARAFVPRSISVPGIIGPTP